MNDELKQAVLKFLQEDVRELVDTYDWLGTGSDSRWADRQQREWREKLAVMIEKVKSA